MGRTAVTSAKAPPIWYVIARGLPYGRYRVLNYLRRKGMLDRVASFPFHGRSVVLPLDYYPSARETSDYMKFRISTFAAACDKHLDRYDFIDCGANLGLFSAQFTFYSERVQKLTAIEPNRQLFSILQTNLQNINAAEVECLNLAVADFEGRGRLVEPEYDPGSPDAMYLQPDPAGDIEVTTLSAVLRRRTQPRVAIKLDIEGLEGPVLCGAEDAIRALDRVVLCVEIHKTVLARVGMSDLDMLAQIESIRPFTWINADDGKPVSSQHAILEQVNLDKQCDLIGIG
jgi:FkbM family methyltransferase